MSSNTAPNTASQKASNTLFSVLPLAFDLRHVIIIAIALIAFSLPFGNWQEQILGGLTVPKICLPVILLAFVLKFLVSKNKKLYIYPPLILYGIFLVLTGPTLLTNGAAGKTQFILLCGYGVLMAVTFNTLQNLKDILIIIRAYAFGLSCMMIITALAYFQIYDLGNLFGQPILKPVLNLHRLLGTETNPNAFATFIMVGLPISITLFFFDKYLVYKVFWMGLAITLLFALSLTASRSAMLGGFIAIAVAIYLKSTINKRNTILFFLSLPICFVLAIYLPKFIVTHTEYAKAGEIHTEQERLLEDKQQSISNRLEYLPVAWDIFKQHPIWGVEHNTIRTYAIEAGIRQKTPHNIFLDILLNFGLPAALFFTTSLIWLGLDYAKMLKNTKNDKKKTLYALLMACIIGLLVNGMFHSTHFNSLLWVIISLSLFAPRIGCKKQQLSPDSFLSKALRETSIYKIGC